MGRYFLFLFWQRDLAVCLLIGVYTLLCQMLQLRVQRAMVLFRNIGDLAQQRLRKTDTRLNSIRSQVITPLTQFDYILPKIALTIYKQCVIVFPLVKGGVL